MKRTINKSAAMSRLAHVLRAGEAHRQSVRTGTLSMKDMDDDTLRSILNAVARGEPNEACNAVKKWCALDKSLNRVCKEDSDGLWRDLATRVFGPNAPTVYTDPGTGQQNFYALCKRARAQKYIQQSVGYVFNGTNETFLALLGDILAHIDNGGKEKPEGRIHLTKLVKRLFDHFWEEFDGDAFLDFCDSTFLYSMLEIGRTREEKDAALDLLVIYASNHDEYADNQLEDLRYGYETKKIWILKQLYTDGNIDRKLKVLKIWKELLLPLSGTEVNYEMTRYAHELVAMDVQATLANTIADQNSSFDLRNMCAFVLEYIAFALHHGIN